MLFIQEILTYAHNAKASDVHLTVGLPPLIRVNGNLMATKFPKLLPEDTQKLAEEILTPYRKKELTQKGESDFSYAIKGMGRFRVNVFRQRGTLALALRMIPMDVPSIDDLNLPEVLKELAIKKRGLILVTGPTGSGKSTTLAAMIDYINKNKNSHILTLEDPIEYLHRHGKSMINQREIGSDSLKYVDALRAALRQDPDVILIGEMRDLETISTAVTAAETGHLVLSTLHTIGAVQTVDRIIDVFPPEQQQQIRIQLSAVLEGVISQQLIQKADKSGRVAALEIMLNNAAIRNHIRDGKTHQLISDIQMGKKQGMICMDEAIMRLCKTGQITYEDALLFSVDKEMFTKLL